jgi:outer membrane receptor for ferrienterochelin and colicins
MRAIKGLIWILLLHSQAAWANPPGAEPEAMGATQDLTTLRLEDLMKIKVDTVYAASKHAQNVAEAPASVTVVTAEQIRRYGYRTLADVLRSVSGFYVSFDRYQCYIGVRGFSRPGDYNSRVLLLLDGHRLNDNIYNAAAVGTDFPFDLALIERIEIIRGPSSSLYGASAFFGVINIISKKGDQIKGGQALFEGGSLETVHGSLTYGERFKSGLDLVLTGSGYHSQGQKNLYFQEFDGAGTHNGVAANADQDQYEHLYGNVQYKGFNLQGLYSFRKKGLSAAPWEIIFNEPSNVARDERRYLDFSYEKSSQDKKTTFLARLYLDQYAYTGDYRVAYGEEDPSLLTTNKDKDYGDWWGTEAKFSRQLGKHTLTVGFEFRDNFKQVLFNFDVDPYYVYTDDRRSSLDGGLYLQDEWRIHPKLLFNLGIRHDHYTTFGGTTNPRLGMIWTPKSGSVLKFLYGQAFRAPNVYEMYYADDYNYKINPDLKPETISSYEAVFEQRLGKHLNGSVSAFYNDITQLIDQQVDSDDGLLIFRNLSAAHAKGFEAELTGDWKESIEGRISYTFQQATDKVTGQWLTNSPRHMGKANVSLPVWKKNLFAGLEIQGLSQRKAKNEEFVSAFCLANLTLSTRRIKDRISFSVSAFNLFDRKYEDPAPTQYRQETIPQDGRVVTGRVTLFF